MFGTTASYMTLGKVTQQYPTDSEVLQFMQAHTNWIDDAVTLFRSLVPPQIPVQQATTALRPPTATHEGWNQQLVTLGLGAGVIATAAVLGLLGGYFGML